MKKYEKWHILVILIGLVAMIAGPYLVYFVQHIPPPRSEWWHLYVDVEHLEGDIPIYSNEMTAPLDSYGLLLRKTELRGKKNLDYYRYEKLENGSKVHLAIPATKREYFITNRDEKVTYTFVTPYGWLSFQGEGIYGMDVNCQESYIIFHGWPEDQEKTVSVAFSSHGEKGERYCLEGTFTGSGKVGLNRTLENGEYQDKGLLVQGLTPTARWMLTEDGTRVDNIKVAIFGSLKELN